MKKNNKINKLKTTTALTLLTAITFFSYVGDTSATTTSNNSLIASASVTKACTITATDMLFSAYLESAISATSTVTATCTNGTTGAISMADATNGPDAGSYKLIRVTSPVNNGSLPADYLKITFKKTHNNDAMYSGAANGTLSHVGTGAAVTTDLGITGTIPETQTSRTAGTFSKLITLNITYTE